MLGFTRKPVRRNDEIHHGVRKWRHRAGNRTHAATFTLGVGRMGIVRCIVKGDAVIAMIHLVGRVVGVTICMVVLDMIVLDMRRRSIHRCGLSRQTRPPRRSAHGESQSKRDNKNLPSTALHVITLDG
jgi:hypothetical protein